MVIVDTDVFIASIRGNEIAESLLRKYGSNIAVSAITLAELFVGATNKAKKQSIENILSDHELIPVSKTICDTALRLIKTYNNSRTRLFLADAFIAATCLEQKASLLTFNSEDFRFIKGMKLAK